MSNRRLIALALVAGLPHLASAQFTTFIPPKNKVADSAKSAVVAEQRAQTDSVMKMQLTNMKAWVDSAAGTVAAPMTMSDSLARAATADTLVSAPPVTDSMPALRNGERAPATASALPLLALLGAITLGIGTVMLAGTKLGRDRG